ncbi:MAG: NUDIX domain-containing protein [Actinomycetota bacterium]
MPMSSYVESLRDKIGHDLLLLPGVTAVIRDGDRLLLARHAHSRLWSLIGGGVEPGEEPADALRREVQEEIGARVRILRIAGAYGGELLMAEYPNGDRVAYVTTVYECELLETPEPDGDEIVEIGWFTREEIPTLERREWIDRVIDDCPI